jgi:hypothetical protein
MAKASPLCVLSLEQLNDLSTSLDEIAALVMNPAIRADIAQARLAVQDLASLRFAIQEGATADELRESCP